MNRDSAPISSTDPQDATPSASASEPQPLSDNTEELIAEWSVRVLEFRTRPSRRTASARDEARLVRAFRVRDQLNNRLRCGTRSVSACSDRMSRVLDSADDMLRELTESAAPAEGFTAHGHYAKASEWWWSRVLLTRAEATEIVAA